MLTPNVVPIATFPLLKCTSITLQHANNNAGLVKTSTLLCSIIMCFCMAYLVFPHSKWISESTLPLKISPLAPRIVQFLSVNKWSSATRSLTRISINCSALAMICKEGCRSVGRLIGCISESLLISPPRGACYNNNCNSPACRNKTPLCDMYKLWQCTLRPAS